MVNDYFQITLVLDRLHRVLLQLIEEELQRVGAADLSSAQALILLKIGDGKSSAGTAC
jgi:hypothetical protein